MAAIKAETKEQILIINWVRQRTDLPVIYIENEGRRSPLEASIVKKMGLAKGACDLMFPRPNKDYSGLWMEVKAEKGVLSLHQKKFIKERLSEGYMALAVWGHKAAIHFLRTFYSLPLDTLTGDIGIP